MLFDLCDPQNRWYLGVAFARKLFAEGHLTHSELKDLVDDFYSTANSLNERRAFEKIRRMANKHQDLYHKFRTLSALKGYPIGTIDETFISPVRSRRRQDHEQDG